MPHRVSARNYALANLGRPHVSETDRVPPMMLEQQEFNRLLCLERKRSERSGKPLGLLLLDGAGLFATDGLGSTAERVASVLQSSIRDTDVTGWHETDRVMAVLFTDISEPATDAMHRVSSRITAAVQQVLPYGEAKLPHISEHVFPEPGREPDLSFYPEVSSLNLSKKGVIAKRAIDIIGSVAALVLLSPLFLLIGCAIKLTSKGPVLFRQSRVGQYGHKFVFLKFRSMYVNCDPTIHKEYVSRFIAGEKQTLQSGGDGRGVYKLTTDPRVTPLGRALRKWSLDELPQFINVLKGEMSLVGPRPALPYEVERYRFWHRRRLLDAKPGITGLWQVSGRSRTSFDEMVRLDLRYIQHASIKLDLKILLKTPRAVFSGTGAY